MKSSVGIGLVASMSVIFTGCLSGGGGGDGGVAIPLYSNTGTNSGTTPPAAPVDPYTTEYNTNPALGLAGFNTAFDAGYTGTGIKIATFDTGINPTHSEYSANFSRTNAVEETVVYTYDPLDLAHSHLGVNGWSATTSVVNSTQIGRVNYSLANANHVYGAAPTVTISGDGSGATAQAIIDGSGHLVDVVITNPGTGYTNATITIDDPSGNVSSSAVKLGGVDYNGHGTFTASEIIAARDANGFLGAAYNSTLYSYKTTFTNDETQIDLGRVLNGAAWAQSNGINIVNQSFGAYVNMAGFAGIDNYRNALNANVSFVSAAGNEGNSCLTINQCLRPAALPWEAGMSDLLTKNGAWIVVGALNADGTDIAAYSNRAGITKSNYILAPGSNNVGAALGGGLALGSGTSFAAPIVSGAMALMYQKWPLLTGSQMANILFTTADDLGAAGVDDVYGNGRLNLNKAFAPVGPLAVPTSVGSVPASSGSAVVSTAPTATMLPLIATGMMTGTAMGASLKSFESLNNTIMLDSYSRDYKISLTSAVQQNDPLISDAMDFDNFTKIRHGHFTMGVDMARNRGAIGYDFDKTFGIMATYSDDLFGTVGSGLLGFSNAKTYYINAKKILKEEDYKLEAQATYGYGVADTVNGSLIHGISATQGVGGKLRATYDGFGMGYEALMHVVSGNMDFEIPVGVSNRGDIIMQREAASLAPQSFEQKVGLIYEKRVDGFNFWATANHVYNKYNLSGISDNEIKFMLSYIY